MRWGPQSVLASAARDTSGNSGAIDSIIQRHTGSGLLLLAVNVTAASGTLDLSVEWTLNGGFTWHKGDPADTFTQITAPTGVVKAFQIKGSLYRIVWTIAGGTPSFTFSADESVI